MSAPTGWRLLRTKLGALRGQAVAHIFFAMLIATVSLVVIAMQGYGEFRAREIDQKFESLRGYYGDRLVRVEYAWKSAAEQLRARLEFGRILEQQDDKRWPKFTAFLNAQRVFGEFPTLLVLSSDGRVLYRYGVIAHTLDADTIRVSEWHFEPALGELYRVFREPIWLGAEGQGQLVLLKPLDNAALKDLVIPEAVLAIDWWDRVVAMSRDDYSVGLATDVRQVVNLGAQRLVQARVAWPGTAAPRPTLLAYRELHDILPIHVFLYWLLAAVAAITLLLWLALGRWLAATVRRLEGVDSALDGYARQLPRATVEEHLLAARQRRDEINNLADGIGELIQAVDAREREQARYLETLALLEEAVLELDCEGNIRHASPGWNKLAHCDNAAGRNLLDFIHPADASALHAQCGVLRSGEKNHLLFRVRLAGPNPEQQSWIECRFLGFRDERGEIAGIRGVLRDITQTYLHEKQISHMALHDALTSLPNRVLLEDRLKIALRMATRTGDKVCVCFIDIDHFKNVNDTLGHKAGDRLLVAFANLLRGELRAGDTLARWGGDEFVLLLPGMPSEQDIREVTHKIGAVIQQPLLLDGAEMRMTFSLGAAIYPDDAENSEVLFSQADRAMFYAKAQGRNQSCFFGDMTSKGIGKKELYVQNRLASAINAGQIQAWFQPIVCARTGACVGVEVLARWHDDELGWISPATFIPIAENIGLIRELGQQVWQASLAMQEHCRAAGRKLRFAVNVSKRQLFIPSFTEQALAELERRGIPSGEIVWEVTESVALRDVEHAAERLHELKAAGFKIAIDDFGTGYSSLSQLHEIHADELKIDISFVRRIHEPAGLSLVQAIIHIASALGLQTVAEGVEDASAADALCELGVDYLQGYHFARPMPREEFLHWLESHQAQPVAL
ncbi:MAG: EAL domain-containing protein [Gammaproteobacteria bacterium]|nr:EAL domain-containing protein [Gammaproteobacteria bacterium]